LFDHNINYFTPNPNRIIVPSVSSEHITRNSNRNNTNVNNNNNNNEMSDLFYCRVCDNYMTQDEKEDHLYSHQMERHNSGTNS